MTPAETIPARAGTPRSVRLVWLATMFLLSSLGPVGLGSTHMLPGPSDHFGIHLEAVPTVAHPQVNSPTAIGGTARTFVLFNHTSVGGNFPAVTAAHPYGIAYDPVEGTLWFTAQDYVGIVDPVTALGIRWLPAGLGALNLVYDNISGVFYITDSGAANVTVLNATTLARVATIPVRNIPNGVAFDWQTNEVYVSIPLNNTVSIINATTNRVVGNLTTGKSPQGIAFDPQQHEIFVANFQNQNVTTINATNRTVIGNITIKPSLPGNVLFNPLNDRIYLTGASGGVAIINPVTNTVLTTLHPGAQPTGLGLDNTGHTLFVTDYPNGIVYIINATTLVTTHVGVGTLSFPNAVAYVPSQSDLFVANRNTIGASVSNLTVVSIGSTSKTTGAVPIDSFPTRTIYVPQRHAIYLYDGGSGQLLELSEATGAVNRTVFVGYTPGGISLDSGLAYDSAHGRLYVDYFDPVNSGVVVVDASTFTILKTLAVGLNPSGIAYDGMDGKVFVANAGTDNVSVISTSTVSVVGAVPVGTQPLELAFAPAADAVYVANSGSNNVSVIRGSNNTLAASLGVGSVPAGIAFDSGNGKLYVANAGGGNLTVISSATNQTVESIAIPGVASGLGQVYYDPWNGSIDVAVGYVALASGLLVIVNDTNDSFEAAFTVGYQPTGMAYDPALGITFVANFLGGTLSLVAWSVELPLVFQSFQAVPASVELGNATVLTVSVLGGVPPLTYAYSTLPSGCASANLAALSCTPTQVGAHVVGVNVTDPTGGHVSGVARFTVQESGFSASLSVTPSVITYGASVFINASVTGGVAPIVYSYPTLPTGCSSANLASIHCTPTALGNLTAQLRVDDASGSNATASATLQVIPRPPPPPPLVIDSVVATPSTLVLGGSVLIQVHASGGPAPNGTIARYSYAYTELPVGCTGANTANLTCSPTVVGLYHPTVRVTDLSGNSTNASTTVNVTAPPPGSHSTAPAAMNPWPWVAAGVLILVVAAGLAWYFLRRRPAPPVPAEPPVKPT